MRHVKLEKVLREVQPGFASGKNLPKGTLQVRMNNVGTDGSLNWDKMRRVPANEQQVRKYALDDRDVLFNCTNSPNLVGKTAIFRELEEKVVFSNHFFRIRVEATELDPGYLHRWLTALWGRGQFENMCIKWVNQASVRKDDLLSLQIPLPPLPEQRRIAAILDKADALRRKRAEALRLTDQFLQSVFLDMFGDPVTNPKGWETLLLGEMIVNGPQNGLYKPASDYGSGTRIIRIDSFYDGQIIGWDSLKRVRLTDEDRQKYVVSQGEVLINRVNSPKFLGKAALVPTTEEPAVYESNMMRFAVDTQKLVPLFLVYQLGQPFIKRQVRTLSRDAVNQSSINQSDVKSLKVRVPPISLQQGFASIVSKARSLRAAKLIESSKQAHYAYNALVNSAFRGAL